MGDIFSEYLHSTVATIVFGSAVTLLLVFIGMLSAFNKIEIDDLNTKTSVTMDTQLGYSDDVIYIKGSAVYTDIISQNENMTIILDGSELDSDYLKKIREKDPSCLQDLRSRISMDDDYLIKHEYYSNNEIKAVIYTHS